MTQGNDPNRNSQRLPYLRASLAAPDRGCGAPSGIGSGALAAARLSNLTIFPSWGGGPENGIENVVPGNAPHAPVNSAALHGQRRFRVVPRIAEKINL